MQKHLFIAIALALGADGLQAQTTTYGGGNAPYSVVGGYNSDYSPDGTIVLSDGAVSLSGNATYEHGNNLLQNDGSWTSAGSLDLFAGTGSNTIGGSSAPSFYDAQFNIGAGNIMAITNAQGIQVSNELQFNNGITTTVRSNTSAGAVHFAAGATYTGAGTDAQHVDGYVSKAGTTAFIFPVGSGTDLRTVSITAPAAPTELSTAWFAGSPGTIADPSDGSTHSITAVAAPLQSISEAGFWDWIPVSGSDDGITVTVSIPDIGGFGNSTDLRLAGWDGTQWIDLSGSATATGNLENNSLSGTIPAGVNITALAIGSLSTPLPVTFSAFNVAAQGCRVLIGWQTAQEINNDYFLVERSRDGRTFDAIAKMQGAGNSAEPNSYSASDEQPFNGRNYYRIQQVDKDGKRSYSGIKTAEVSCSGRDDIQIFPTVSSDDIQVRLPQRYEGAAIDLLTALGQKIVVPVDKEHLQYRLHVDRLTAGMYIIRIVKGNEIHSYKIVKR
ncbi:T9SS type A sorting domain-containing protein [Taibaiella koreensis]|uniref:T9SS type A sorting domain-containing protein n=1 Tax=Taibaiella koreensis TaxID=1268548 RepID=UPI000E59BA6E|nr:T9SS type A sorting domain-containing protein [Taibaiella koreensis]